MLMFMKILVIPTMAKYKISISMDSHFNGLCIRINNPQGNTILLSLKRG